MGEYFNQLPDRIQKHIPEVLKSSGLPETEEFLEKMANTWLEKKVMFEEQIKTLDMEETDFFAKEDERGALLLTYSGSLISIGTLKQGVRWAEYASIEFRQDVKAIVMREGAKIANDINIEHSMEFIGGPIKSSSNIMKIVVCKEGVTLEEQEKRIREATIFLTNGFVKINRTLISPGQNFPDQFNMKSMIANIAAKNDITQKKAKQIIEDFTYMIEAGLLLGERVPIGKIGKVFLNLRPAQKARVGRNPATGEEITIKAKPEMFVPKMNFSSAVKEKAELIKTSD